jgi:hypothetical protein
MLLEPRAWPMVAQHNGCLAPDARLFDPASMLLTDPTHRSDSFFARATSLDASECMGATSKPLVMDCSVLLLQPVSTSPPVQTLPTNEDLFEWASRPMVPPLHQQTTGQTQATVSPLGLNLGEVGISNLLAPALSDAHADEEATAHSSLAVSMTMLSTADVLPIPNQDPDLPEIQPDPIACLAAEVYKSIQPVVAKLPAPRWRSHSVLPRTTNGLPHCSCKDRWPKVWVNWTFFLYSKL